jgi:hypothetical protein
VKNIVYLLLAIGLAYIVIRLIRYMMARAESPFKYFTYSEFDQPNLKGSGAKYMSTDFIHKLDAIRAEVGFPMIITSGYRSQAYNDSLSGSVPNSSHIKGLAADIAAPSEDMRFEIAKAAINQGINRIGWGNTFIHLDVDQDKSPNVVWGYGNQYPNFYELENLA